MGTQKTTPNKIPLLIPKKKRICKEDNHIYNILHSICIAIIWNAKYWFSYILGEQEEKLCPCEGKDILITKFSY
jgi:hypothetical protein